MKYIHHATGAIDTEEGWKATISRANLDNGTDEIFQVLVKNKLLIAIEEVEHDS